jgi:beta-exotoxin I transport system permease protein
VSAVLRNVFAKTLWDQRRSLLWWSLGLLAVVAIYVLPYRTYLDSGMLRVNTDTPVYQALGYDNSPAGYLQGTLFALLGPLLVAMMAVAAGARAIAGDEEAGSLELLLAHPVSRTRLLLERTGALAAAVTVLGLVIWATTVAAVAVADLGIGAGRLAATTLGLVLLALGFGTVALAAGAASGRRGLTLGVSAAVAVAAYLANTVAPQVDALKGVEKWSPFHWYLGGDPLRTGADLGHLALLAAIPLVMVALALWRLNRRDIAV